MIGVACIVGGAMMMIVGAVRNGFAPDLFVGVARALRESFEQRPADSEDLNDLLGRIDGDL